MISFDPLAPEVLDDRYPQYAWLRANAPIVWSEARSSWIVTRYDDVSSMLRDHVLFRKRNRPARGTPIDGVDPPRLGLQSTDPPEYHGIRSLVPKVFTGPAITAIEPRIEAIVDDLVDALAGRSNVDLMADFAISVPARVIAHVLGLPVADLDRITAWSEQRRHGPAPAMFVDYMRSQVDDRRARPASDFITQLIDASDAEGAVVSDDEIASMLVHLVSAGHETTANLIGNTVAALLAHPHEMERTRTGELSVDVVIEEVLRYDTPFHVQKRTSAQRSTIDSVVIDADEEVLLVLASGNRDADHYGADADQFRPDRNARDHLAFGMGPHFCLGARLARVEAREAVRCLLARFPVLRLDPSRPTSMACTVQHHGFGALPLLLT